MTCRALFRSIASLRLLAALTGAAASLEPANLNCEYLTNPLGIDANQPRLSWQLRPTDPAVRGQRQTAYHLLVASDPTMLERERADLWDSRWQISGDSQLVAYGGKPLR